MQASQNHTQKGFSLIEEVNSDSRNFVGEWDKHDDMLRTF